MFVIYVYSPKGAGGEGRELLPRNAWQQFPALLSAPAGEPRVPHPIQENRDSK
jgi:hypothetical protein